MKVIMCSRHFPAKHPKVGDITYFMDKILYSLNPDTFIKPPGIYYSPKHHTIRAGNRWKAGDMASLRIWSGKPYRSKQIEFAQVEIKEVIPIFIYVVDDSLIVGGSSYNKLYAVNDVAKNDGLDLDDFAAWFAMSKLPFSGQIICWKEGLY